MERLSDQELLRELRSGSHQAFSIIYQRYWKRVLLFANSRLHDTKKSQDLVQEVFVSLWTRRENLEINNLAGWLNACVVYSVLKMSTAERAKADFLTSINLFSAEAAPADNPVVSTELLKAFKDVVEKMPRQRKRIFQLRYEENLKTRQIAEQLNISQKTVQNQLLSSYKEIRSLLTRVLLLSLLFMITL